MFSAEDAARNAGTYFRQALESAQEHPMFNIKNAITAQALILIAHLLACIDAEPTRDFWTSAIAQLWLILESDGRKRLQDTTYVNIWVQYHSLRGQLLGKWENILRSTGLHTTGKHVHTTYQYVLLSMFQYLMEDRNNRDAPENDETPTESSMDREEEKVLRYVSGYVPYAILKRLRKQTNEMANVFCKFLDTWEVKGSGYSKTFLEYTREWIDSQNRGGLFKVSDNVYLFFRAMELVSRRFLTHDNLVKLQGVDIKAVLGNKIFANNLVQQYWSNLIDNKLNTDASQKLFDIVVNFYIKIRSKAFVKVYLDLKKMKCKNVSKKAEKALRKTLESGKS